MLIFHVFATLAELERDVFRERTQAGLAAAPARRRRGGRRKVAALNDPRNVAMAQALYSDESNAIADKLSDPTGLPLHPLSLRQDRWVVVSQPIGTSRVGTAHNALTVSQRSHRAALLSALVIL